MALSCHDCARLSFRCVDLVDYCTWHSLGGRRLRLLSGCSSAHVFHAAAGLAGDGRPDNDSVGTAANHAGISLANAAITTGTGNVTLYGSAWNAAIALLHGVQVSGGTTVTSTTGDITMRGRGGNGTAQNYGVYIKDNGTSISTNDGDVRIIGIGGNGSGNNNAGITIEGSSIASLGTGASAGIVTLDGTGGSGNAINFGISIDSSLLSTVDGDLAINGVGDGKTHILVLQRIRTATARRIERQE